MNNLRSGPELAQSPGMKNKYLLTIFLILFWPARVKAGDQKPETNVNSRYEVENVEISGIPDPKISKALHDEMQKLVGQKYNQEATDALAKRLRKELRDYSITVKVKRGDKPEHVKVVFEGERTRWKRFEFAVPPAALSRNSRRRCRATGRTPICSTCVCPTETGLTCCTRSAKWTIKLLSS